MKRIYLILTSLLFLFITSASAQQQINGDVSDVTGEPVIGASVLVKGTTDGTVTNGQGKFTINASLGDTLQITSLGYNEREIAINNTEMQISLEQNVSLLDDIVVIGYGTVRKKDLTGAVTNIQGSDIKAEGVSDVTRALQGRMPGVEIESAGGAPGAGTRILIRGVGTLGNSAPLYIVDGVQVSDINNLTQNDIASIDILKDASAAAIYGSRAANGVVIVTTKSGKAGEPVIQFNTSIGVQKLAHKVGVLNAQEWAQVSNAAHDAAGLPRLDIAKDPGSLGVGTDWQDAIYRNALVQQYGILVSGGGNSGNYSISGGYDNQDGIVNVTGYKRYKIRVKSETTKGRFKFGQTALATREKWIQMPGGWGGQGGNPIGSAAKMIPVFQIYDSAAIGGFAGAYGPVVNVANPVAQLHLENINRELTSILLNAYGEVTILSGLKYRLNLGYTNNSGTNNDYWKRYNVGTLFSHPTNDLNQSKDQDVLVLLENTLNYERRIGKHNFQALAGYTYQEDQYSFMASGRTNLPDGIRVIDAGSGVSTSGGNKRQSDLISYLGRVIYSFDNRYLLTASIRRDGSSRFASGHSFGNFPSVALGWNISNESFFSNMSNSISNLKLRASYGELGNQEIGDYLYAAAVVSNINYVIGTDQQRWNGAIQTTFSSPNIKWENTKTSNIGIDLGLWENRFNLTADYYIKKTTDVLLNVPIPGSAGSTSDPIVNAGTLKNNGFELGLNYAGNSGDFNYNIFGTFSTIRNKVINLGTGTQQIFGGQPTHHGASTTVTQAGGPVSAFYLIKAIGIFNSQDEVDEYSKNGQAIQPNASPGDIKFLDANDDGRIDDADRVFVGSPFPNFEYGAGFNVSWRYFDLNVFAQGTHGNKIYNGLRQDLESMSLEFNYSKETLNAWTPDNHSNIPRAVTNDPNFNDRSSSRFLENGSYLRLKTLQIGYELPDDVINHLRISGLRFFVSIDNLFTITKYTGFNPDIGRSGSILDRGVDYGHVAYPLAKTYSVGVQLGL